MFATATRSRRSNLTNVVVRQSMRTGATHFSPIKVQVFDILNVVLSSASSPLAGRSCRFTGASAVQTSQNVCSYYDVRMVVHYKW